MFGTSRQHPLLKKIKQHGISAMGTVTEITQGYYFPEDVREIFGEKEPATIVKISYQTQQNTDEVMLLRISENADNPYTVGDTVEVRYLFENGHYTAIPEKSLHQQNNPKPSDTARQQTDAMHRQNHPYSANISAPKKDAAHPLGIVLLAIGVFAASAGVTVLVLLHCLHG